MRSHLQYKSKLPTVTSYTPQLGLATLRTTSARRLNSDRHMVPRLVIIKLPSQRSERSDPHHTVNRVLERTCTPFGLSIRWSSSFGTVSFVMTRTARKVVLADARFRVATPESNAWPDSYDAIHPSNPTSHPAEGKVCANPGPRGSGDGKSPRGGAYNSKFPLPKFFLLDFSANEFRFQFLKNFSKKILSAESAEAVQGRDEGGCQDNVGQRRDGAERGIGAVKQSARIGASKRLKSYRGKYRGPWTANRSHRE